MVVIIVVVIVIGVVYRLLINMTRVEIPEPERGPMTQEERQKNRDSIEDARASMDIEIAARELERMDLDELDRQIINEFWDDDCE